MSRNLSVFLRAVVALLCSVLPVVGQTTFGSITGTVTDQSGAVIPDARVMVTNEDTRVERRVATTAAGVYNAPNLNAGRYRVRIEAPGFATFERGGLILSSNQIINVDAQLKLAPTAATTEVVAAATVIETETSGLNYVKTARDLQNLPLLSRQYGDKGFYDYTLFNPGVSRIPGSSLPVVQGLRIVQQTLPTVDGIAVMSYPIGPGPVQPSLEGVQEVNVQLATPPAEFPTAAAFTVVSKSGTNEFHGAAFWDYNSNALNARDFFSPKAPFRVFHNFGGSLGGPIKRNKTFFFGDYEAAREAATNVLVADVPLPAWRSGDFSGSGVTITDPATGQPFAGNKIPADRISAVSQKAQDLFFPPPNFGAPDLQSGNYRARFPGTTGFTRFDHFDARVDHNFSAHDTAFARATYRRLPLDYTDVVPTIGHVSQLRSSRAAVLSWTHTFTPVVLNEFRTGMTRMVNFYEPDAVGLNIIQQLGIQGVQMTSPLHNVPLFNITGVTSIDLDGASDNHTLNLDTSFEWTDNLNWTRGAHAFKFGFDLIRDQLGRESWPSSIYGAYNFSGTYTGFGYADFLLGIPQSTTRSIPTPSAHLRATVWSVYGQDQFKISRRLTLNYGVRWELPGPYYDRFNTTYSFDPRTGSLVVPDEGLKLINPLYPKNIPILTASRAGYPQHSLVAADKSSFYPRVGFAYKPFSNDRTVIRGGWGLYGNLINALAGRSMIGGPFSGSETFTNRIVAGAPLFAFPNPFLSAGTTSTQNVAGINPRLVTPYTQQWNFTIERQVGSVGIRTAYVGSHAAQLAYTRDLNLPPPSTIPFASSRRFYPLYNRVTWVENGGYQQYHALEISAAKTYGKNLTFNTGWTWAKDMTDTQDGGGFAGTQIQNQFDRRIEKANNAFSVTHRFYGYVIYALPVGRGQRFGNHLPRPLEGALGGWSMAWIAMAQSGKFFTPSFSGFDPSNTNTLGGRPDRIGNGTLTSGRSIQHWFDASAFKIPGCADSDPVCKNPVNVGRFGNSGLNILRGPGQQNYNFTLMKYFPIHENLKLQLRMNSTNFFNHPNFALPGANISSRGSVGRITGTFAPSGGLATAREIDFFLRLEF